MMYAAVFLVFCALLPASMSQRLTDLFPQGGLCGLSTQERVDALRRIKDAADALSSPVAADCSSSGLQPTLIPECGEGVWCRIVDFDVTEADTTCPTGLIIESAGCTKLQDDDCGLATFSTGSFEYSRVCGRATGRSSGTPDGFESGVKVNGITLADGVTLTLSTMFEHIWTFGAANDETDVPCPFNEDASALDQDTISFVEDRYFCDLDPGTGGDSGTNSRKLWTGNCDDLPNDSIAFGACNFNGPPYFNVTLDNPSTEDIDARICLNGGPSAEEVFVESMALFIQ